MRWISTLGQSYFFFRKETSKIELTNKKEKRKTNLIACAFFYTFFFRSEPLAYTRFFSTETSVTLQLLER